MVHPFPTLLVAITTGALTAIAGGSTDAVVRATVAMAAIQAGIGALNDLVDRGRDATRPKPIPRGLVSVSTARVIAVAGLSVGLVVSAFGGPGTLLVAMAGSACGIAYDLRLARTPWSWLPLAVALPLVPVYAWLVATGSVPPEVLRFVPAAVLAGSGLAIANASEDGSIDRAHGPGGIATRMSAGRSRLVATTLLATAILVIRPVGSSIPGMATGLWLAGLVGVVVGFVSMIRGGRGWELQAVGVALAGASAIAAIAAVTAGPS